MLPGYNSSRLFCSESKYIGLCSSISLNLCPIIQGSFLETFFGLGLKTIFAAVKLLAEPFACQKEGFFFFFSWLNEGGLGLRRIMDLNYASFLRHIWAISYKYHSMGAYIHTTHDTRQGRKILKKQRTHHVGDHVQQNNI